MSENNVVELGQKDVAANDSSGREPSATHPSETPDGTSQPALDSAAELDEEIVDALRAARKGLTDGGIGAVIALRREIQIHTALEQLLLEGVRDACVEDENGHLIVSNYRFFAVESEDTPADARLTDTGHATTE